MSKKTSIMRVDRDFEEIAKQFAIKNRMSIPDTTKIFADEIKTIKKRIRRDDIIF